MNRTITKICKGGKRALLAKVCKEERLVGKTEEDAILLWIEEEEYFQSWGSDDLGKSNQFLRQVPSAGRHLPG